MEGLLEVWARANELDPKFAEGVKGLWVRGDISAQRFQAELRQMIREYEAEAEAEAKARARAEAEARAKAEAEKEDENNKEE